MDKFCKEYAVSTIVYRVEKYRNLGIVKKSQITKQGITLIEFPRFFIDELNSFSDLNHPGIYFLINKYADSKNIYVGKSMNLYDRLSRHNYENIKEYNYCYAFSMNGIGNIAVVDYLEYYYIKKINSQNYYHVINSNYRNKPIYTEYDELEFDYYTEAIDKLLTYVGIDLDITSENYCSFVENQTINNTNNLTSSVALPKQKESKNQFDVFKFRDAKLIYKDGSWIMLKGSKIRSRPLDRAFRSELTKKSCEKYYANFIKKTNKFIKQHSESLRLTDNEQYYELTNDISVTSCSLAGDLVCGHISNGWTCWINDNGQTLDQVYRNKETSK